MAVYEGIPFAITFGIPVQRLSSRGAMLAVYRRALCRGLAVIVIHISLSASHFL